MTAFVVTAVALAVLAAALLLRPLWKRGSDNTVPSPGEQVTTYAAQLAQLSGLHRAGALTDDLYAQSKTAVEGKLLARLADPVEGVSRGPSLRLAAGLALFLVVFAAAGYAWLGSPASLALEPGSGASTLVTSSRESAGDGTVSAPHALAPERVALLVDQLTKHLKDQPDDADGWLMLARSLVVLDRHAQAVDAFKQAARLHPGDAAVLADYADALAVTRGRHLDGDPTRLVEQALAADPANAKALALAGTAAFDRRDYPSAVRYWEKLVQIAPDDSFAQQIQGGIAEARELGGMPPVAVAPPENKGGNDRPATISGTVSLAATLQGRAAPDDTVFVFARGTDGSRMPLAILRKQVRDLPLRFTLDDDMAMAASAKLSGVERVIVGARISKSGNATPQPGDLQGMLSAVAVGSAGLQVEINQELKK